MRATMGKHPRVQSLQLHTRTRNTHIIHTCNTRIMHTHTHRVVGCTRAVAVFGFRRQSDLHVYHIHASVRTYAMCGYRAVYRTHVTLPGPSVRVCLLTSGTCFVSGTGWLPHTRTHGRGCIRRVNKLHANDLVGTKMHRFNYAWSRYTARK